MSQSADFQWINKNYASLQAKYPNMYVAVKNGQVLSANRDFGKTYNEAKKKADNFATDFIHQGLNHTSLNCKASYFSQHFDLCLSPIYNVPK